MKKNIKEIIAAVVVIGAFAAYIISQRAATTPTAVISDNDDGMSGTSASHETTNPNSGLASTTVSTPTPVSGYKDGTYTGKVADAYFGPLQVKVVVKDRKISDVVFLQYPNDRDTSVMISNTSMPKLKTEAIAVQSSKVDIISGATQTSEGFVISLQSALDQAKS